MKDEPVEVAVYFNTFEADIAKSKLEAFGVFCFIEDDSAMSTEWFGNSANSKLKLFVRTEDAKRAHEILAENEA